MTLGLIIFAAISVFMFVAAVFPMFANEGEEGWNDVDGTREDR